MDELTKQYIEMIDKVFKAEEVLLSIEQDYFFFAAIATIVDAYAEEHKLSHEDVVKNYETIINVRPEINELIEKEREAL